MNNPITAAMIDAISAQAPAHTITVTWSNGTRATYSATMLDMLKTDPAALDIQDDTTGEMIYIKPDPTETDEAPQEAPQEAPAAEADQQPTPTEEAPQAATQAAEGTDEEEEATPATPGDMLKVRNIIMSKGGYRERYLLTNPHTATRSTWTTEHKVIEILATTPDPDGYRPGCAVDIVTRSIVG